MKGMHEDYEALAPMADHPYEVNPNGAPWCARCYRLRAEHPAPSPREDWKRGAEERIYEMPPLTSEAVWSGSWGAWLINVQDANGHVALPAEMLQRLLIAAYPRTAAPSRGAEADEAAAKNLTAVVEGMARGGLLGQGTSEMRRAVVDAVLACWANQDAARRLAERQDLIREADERVDRVRAQARREARTEALEQAAQYMLSREVTASEFYAREIRSLPLPGAERAPAADEPCYCCRQSCEPGCRCQPYPATQEQTK